VAGEGPGGGGGRVKERTASFNGTTLVKIANQRLFRQNAIERRANNHDGAECLGKGVR